MFDSFPFPSFHINNYNILLKSAGKFLSVVWKQNTISHSFDKTPALSMRGSRFLEAALYPHNPEGPYFFKAPMRFSFKDINALKNIRGISWKTLKDAQATRCLSCYCCPLAYSGILLLYLYWCVQFITNLEICKFKLFIHKEILCGSILWAKYAF